MQRQQIQQQLGVRGIVLGAGGVEGLPQSPVAGQAVDFLKVSLTQLLSWLATIREPLSQELYATSPAHRAGATIACGGNRP